MVKRGHILDILFPLGLLAAFAAAVITVLLLTAGVYQGNVERSASAFSGPTALAYVTEKIHQSDEAEAVHVGRIGESSAVIFTQTYEGAYYDTYIYCYDGSLRELMVKRELEPLASMGRSLIPLTAFDAEELDDGLIRLTCTDEDGAIREAYVSLQSGEGSPWN